MEQALQLLTQFGTKLTELAVQVGPEVYSLAMTAIAMQHIGLLIQGLGMVAFGGALLYGSYRLVKKGIAYPYAEERLNFYIPAAIIAFPGMLIAGIGLFDHLLDIWSWAALYDPRLILAKRVLGL